MTLITDHVLVRKYSEGILTIEWSKSLRCQYIKNSDWWYTYPEQFRVGDKTNTFLNEQILKIQ